MTEQSKVASRYDKLSSDRQSFLDIAYRNSEMTLPYLIRPEGNENTKARVTAQSIGARGVNNLASKLLISLFPPNEPFFDLPIDDFVLEKVAGDKKARSRVEKALNTIVRAVGTRIETIKTRPKFFEILKHLIVVGNILVRVNEDGSLTTYNLNKYVCKRDNKGDVLEVYIKEKVFYVNLPEDVQELIKESVSKNASEDENLSEVEVVIYTSIVKKSKDKWEIYQEVEGKTIGNVSTIKDDELPFLALRWSSTEGDDYGHAHVEDYYEDLKAFNNIIRSVVRGALATTRVILMVKPNGVTQSRTVQDASDGEIISGDANDVSMLQLNKSMDLRVADGTAQKIEERLGYAFLLNSAVRRDAERVTAAEVRQTAAELEETLGGTYSLFSQELQLPYVRLVIAGMQKSKDLPKLPKGVDKPKITVGIEALGRGNDSNKLLRAITGLSPVLELIHSRINWDDFLNRYFVSLGIDTDGLLNETDPNAGVTGANGLDPQMIQQAMQQLPNGGDFNPQMIQQLMQQLTSQGAN